MWEEVRNTKRWEWTCIRRQNSTHLFEDRIQPCTGTDGEMLNICCDILHDCQIYAICLKSRVFCLQCLQQQKHQQNLSATRNNKDKELKEGQNVHRRTARVIKEIQTRDTKKKHLQGQLEGAPVKKREGGTPLNKDAGKNPQWISVFDHKHFVSLDWSINREEKSEGGLSPGDPVGVSVYHHKCPVPDASPATRWLCLWWLLRCHLRVTLRGAASHLRSEKKERIQLRDWEWQKRERTF